MEWQPTSLQGCSSSVPLVEVVGGFTFLHAAAGRAPWGEPNVCRGRGWSQLSQGSVPFCLEQRGNPPLLGLCPFDLSIGAVLSGGWGTSDSLWGRRKSLHRYFAVVGGEMAQSFPVTPPRCCSTWLSRFLPHIDGVLTLLIAISLINSLTLAPTHGLGRPRRTLLRQLLFQDGTFGGNLEPQCTVTRPSKLAGLFDSDLSDLRIGSI